MAIEVRIHPLDFEPDVAIGIDLPMMKGVGASFQQTYTTLDQAVANAKNLILTNKGERVMLPEFGCDLRRVVFENITQDLTEQIDTVIRESFSYWLPYIFINDLRVSAMEDQNKVFINLTISLEGNKFDTRSVQLEIQTAAA